MVDLSVIWFQNDLRVHDHGPLVSGCNTGAPVLPLYIFDLSLWKGQHRSADDLARLKQSLDDLDAALRARGTALSIRIGKPVDVLAALHLSDGIASLHTHAPAQMPRGHIEESKAAAWARRMGIPYRETMQTGLMGPSLSAHEIDVRWNEYMTRPRHKAPSWIKSADIETEVLPTVDDLSLTPETETSNSVLSRSVMGRATAVAALNALMSDTTQDIQMLSDHLEFGLLSYREIYQAGVKQIRMARAACDHDARRHAEAVMKYLNALCLGAHKKRQAATALSQTYRAAALPRRLHTPVPPAASRPPHAARQNRKTTDHQLSFDWAEPAHHMPQHA